MRDLIYQVMIAAFAGGVVDYFNQVQKGTKAWSLFGFLTHLTSALFFGWICGAVAIGFEYSVHLVAAAGGVGGFLGVRVADLVSYKLIGDRRS